VSSVRHVSSPDGTPIAYRASGAGDPVLFVHGAATSGADWAFVARLLRERFTVVTMDRRGRGASGDGEEHSMEREAEDILAVLDAVGAERLVAHSYGALCSMVAAGRTDALCRLVLYEPPIAVRAEWVGGLEELVARGELDRALELFLQGAGASAEHLGAIRASPAWPILLDAMPALPRELSAAAHWRRPRGPIAVPTLFLLGGDTRADAYLDGLDELQEEFPAARRRLIEGQQHVAHVFAAEDFAALLLDFLP
jgi:pimeloyl-ACP methyl ester carboxylesterase